MKKIVDEKNLNCSQGYYILSIFITHIGDSITFMTCGKYSLDIFGITSAFGSIVLLDQIKKIIFNILAGSIVDKYSPKKVAIFLDFLCFFILLFASYFSLLNTTGILILTIIFFINTATIFYNIAIFSIIKNISLSTDIFKINTRSALAQYLGSAVGFACAGFLIERVSISFLLIVDSLSYLLSGILLYNIKIKSISLQNYSKNNSLWVGIKKTYKLLWYYVKEKNKIIYIIMMISIQVNIILISNISLFSLVYHKFKNNPHFLTEFNCFYSIGVIFCSLSLQKYLKLNKNRNILFFLFFLQAFILLGIAFSSPKSLWFLSMIYGAFSALIFPILFSELHTNIRDDFGKNGSIKELCQSLIAIPIIILNNMLIDLVNIKYAYVFMSCLSLYNCINFAIFRFFSK